MQCIPAMLLSIVITITLVTSVLKVDANLGVIINGTSSIRHGIDDFVVKCSPNGTYTQITSYVIYKSNGASNDKIVEQSFMIIEGGTSTVWSDPSFESRANLSGDPMPFGNATITLTIAKDKVTCPSDVGNFSCEISNGVQAPLKSHDLEVHVLTEPESIPPISVKATLNGQDVPTPGNDGRHVFVEGTQLVLNCTVRVGNPSQPIRWCVKEMNDSDWSIPVNMTSDGDVIVDTCQNVMSSYYMFNMTTDSNITQILCEVGGGSTCGSGEYNSTLTVYLAGAYRESEETTDNFTPFPPTTMAPNTKPVGAASGFYNQYHQGALLLLLCAVSYISINLWP